MMLRQQPLIGYTGTNNERLYSTNGYLSPIEAENVYYRSLNLSGYAA